MKCASDKFLDSVLRGIGMVKDASGRLAAAVTIFFFLFVLDFPISSIFATNHIEKRGY